MLKCLTCKLLSLSTKNTTFKRKLKNLDIVLHESIFEN